MKKILITCVASGALVGLVQGICKHLIQKSNRNLEKVYEQENIAREKYQSDKLNELKNEME